MQHIYNPIFVDKNNGIMHNFNNCKCNLLSRLQGNPLGREYLENYSAHEVTIICIVQTFCGLKVLRVLAKKI